ncbi:thiol-disulfide oxidoreductase DCC family protein [Mariniblastus fucicola]|uniref:Thiol-disulfide oxidoreductase n=1 Tax=Mariniblastus fucicola TaxID=980251 RepID=A0A5B9P2Z5_9BACT|nr:DUF393 domain-containing protein [Mariniblastus fucicola]QEG20738.1 hypothetical protein MFFC18_05890 [Mariniblastus fucicola]
MSVDTKPQTKPTDESPSNDAAMARDPNLKSPADLPDADVVIYDGKCVFCKKSVKLLNWWVAKDQLAYVSLHDDWVAQHVPDLTYDQMMKQIYLIDREDGSKHGGVEAIRYLSTRSWKLWLAAPFLYFPGSMPLWQWIYQQIAKRRYLIAGKDDDCDEDGTCKIHFDK